MKRIGKKRWVIPDINIPLRSTGKEPEFLSQDRVTVMNTGIKSVNVRIVLFSETDEPVYFSPVIIKGHRIRKIRINDLINPVPAYLETSYSVMVEADREVVVQFFRMNTGNINTSIMGTIAFGTDHGK